MKNTGRFNINSFGKKYRKNNEHKERFKNEEYFKELERNEYKQIIKNILNERDIGETIYIPLFNFLYKQLNNKNFKDKFMVSLYDTFILEFRKKIKEMKKPQDKAYQIEKENLNKKIQNLLITFQKFHLLLKNINNINIKYENMEKTTVAPDILKTLFKGFNESNILYKTNLNAKIIEVANSNKIKNIVEKFIKNPIFKNNEKIIPLLIEEYSQTEEQKQKITVSNDYKQEENIEEKAPSHNLHPIGPSLGF